MRKLIKNLALVTIGVVIGRVIENKKISDPNRFILR